MGASTFSSSLTLKLDSFLGGRPTQRAIRRGTFKSVKALVAKIEQFVNQYNHTSHPFVWVATANSILEKIKRFCLRISETGH